MSRLALLRREWRRSVARYRNIPLHRIAALYLRALRLHRAPPRSPSPPPQRAERIVVSLSTIPERADRLGPVLRSLLDQSEPADRILLCLPRKALRSEMPYPAAADLNLPPGVQVLACDDLGPATKILPTLLAEPDALVVAVDDDVIYPRDFLSVLLAFHRQNPGCAAGFRGVRLTPGTAFRDLDHVFASGIPAPQPVDILFGTWGYLLPAWLSDGAFHEFEGWPPGLRWVDDVWISGHLARRGVPRMVLRAESMPIETAASFRAALTDTLNRSGTNDEDGIRAFAPYW